MEATSSPNEDWAHFAADLALCLGDLQEDEFLVLASAAHASYYIQFAAQGRSGMRAEAASNAYIKPPEARLSDEDVAAMTRLGWLAPTKPPPGQAKGPPDPGGSPNFFLDLSDPVDFQRLALLTVDTFRQVYRILYLGELRYKSFDKDGAAIRFPSLRLQREP